MSAADAFDLMDAGRDIARLRGENRKLERAVARLEVCLGIARTLIPAARNVDYLQRSHEALEALDERWATEDAEA